MKKSGILCVLFLIWVNTSWVSAQNQTENIFRAIEEENVTEITSILHNREFLDSLMRDINSNPIIHAVIKKKAKSLKCLLHLGANPNIIYKGQTALMYAAKSNNASLVRLLLRYGANVKITDSVGSSPLIMAAESSSVSVLRSLIRYKSPLNLRNKEGHNAHDMAIKGGNHAGAVYLRNVFERHPPDYFDGPYVFFKGKRHLEVTYLKHDSLHRRTDSFVQNYRVKDLKGRFNGFTWDEKSYPVLNELPVPPSELSGINKLLIIGDIHGQCDSLKLFLQRNGVVDENMKWTFGTATIVFMGDIFDRGEQVTEAFWLIYNLENEARLHGGQVQLLLGNHELMEFNSDYRYLSDKYHILCKNLHLNYSHLYSKKSLLGKWLRSKNSMLKIDSLLFVHGGIHPDILKYKVSVDSVNNLMRNYLNAKRESKFENHYLLNFLLSLNGPFWFRGLTDRYENGMLTESQVDEILKYYNVKHILVGHTYFPEVRVFFHHKVITTDVPFYLPDGFPMQGILVNDKKISILTTQGELLNPNLNLRF